MFEWKYVVPNRIIPPYVVLTHWKDEDAFKNWVGSDDFKMAHQNPMNKNAFLEGGGLEQFEVIISTDG
ncbi:MAG: antibiotic biosynthesis monooxygenase [Thiohalomonadales bacterium]